MLRVKHVNSNPCFRPLQLSNVCEVVSADDDTMCRVVMNFTAPHERDAARIQVRLPRENVARRCFKPPLPARSWQARSAGECCTSQRRKAVRSLRRRPTPGRNTCGKRRSCAMLCECCSLWEACTAQQVRTRPTLVLSLQCVRCFCVVLSWFGTAPHCRKDRRGRPNCSAVRYSTPHYTVCCSRLALAVLVALLLVPGCCRAYLFFSVLHMTTLQRCHTYLLRAFHEAMCSGCGCCRAQAAQTLLIHTLHLH